jgi:hydrogenase maturation protease
VIGVGNPWRGDDGAGLEVARRVGGVPYKGDGTGLIDVWDHAADVVVVDAAAAAVAPGTIHRFDAAASPLPARSLRSSSHHFGVADAVELARSLDRLPARLTVYAIEGEDFAAGHELSPAVRRAVDQVVGELGRAGA